LLNAFWRGHDATEIPYSPQYRSAIFYTNDKQRLAAAESKQEEEAKRGLQVLASIEPLTNFYSAENYHQKYYLKHNSDLMTELLKIYPDPEDFVNSTAVARLNGYVGGWGDPDQLEQKINNFGLSESGKQELREIAKSGLILGCPVQLPVK
jgi:peptide-methionine (S)-S-oxide reductase